ncbi:MAG: prepilin-type N-terminal cleavage/methylation domain-containing protein, partial [Phycisphaerae bacterium]|nr:prepilin-type N-terminal cleavage/methylation domain-containing protein [Phycisphaerae bacterium]
MPEPGDPHVRPRPSPWIQPDRARDRGRDHRDHRRDRDSADEPRRRRCIGFVAGGEPQGASQRDRPVRDRAREAADGGEHRDTVDAVHRRSRHGLCDQDDDGDLRAVHPRDPVAPRGRQEGIERHRRRGRGGDRLDLRRRRGDDPGQHGRDRGGRPRAPLRPVLTALRASRRPAVHRAALHARPRPSRAIPDCPGGSARAVALPGFSLLELVMVLAVMGIVLAVAMPRHAAAMDRYRADGAASGLVAAIRRERAAAASTGVPRRIAFDAAANSYTVFAGDVAPAKVSTALLGAGPFPATLSVADFDGGPDLRLDAFG